MASGAKTDFASKGPFWAPQGTRGPKNENQPYEVIALFSITSNSMQVIRNYAISTELTIELFSYTKNTDLDLLGPSGDPPGAQK